MIVVNNVTKIYQTRRWGPHVVLDKINLTVRKGQHVGVMGRNGAGKSTLVRLIGGAELPTSGSIRRGMSVSWPLAFTGAFQPFLTGLDNLKFVCRIYGADYREALPFVEEFSELGIYMQEPLYHYSSGMQARLGFAISLAIDFDCFLIDEVIVVGDSRFHEKCRVELFEKRKDRAFIIVSHDPGVISSHCDEASVISKGRLKSFSDVNEAYAYYQTCDL